MDANEATEAMVKIVELLKPLTSEDRQRVIGAALVLLGEKPAASQAPNAQEEPDAELGELPVRAKNWMKQNGLSSDVLSEVFHVMEGSAELIAADIPGKNNKEKTINAYVLVGISKLLATGSPAFDDKTARLTCKNLGCFNEANHAAYMAGKGNEFTGSKDKGWELTAPGLKRGATLIKEITNQKA